MNPPDTAMVPPAAENPLQPRARPEKQAPRTTSALAIWALALGLTGIVGAGSLALAIWAGTDALVAGAPTIEFVLLAMPVLALAAFIVGIVATVRGARRGQRIWMAVTGLVLGPTVLIAWWFLVWTIAYTMSGQAG